MNGFCRGLLAIITTGGVIFAIFIYHLLNHSLYVVDMEKCRDQKYCSLEPIVSWGGVFIFAMQLVVLAGIFSLAVLTISLCAGRDITNKLKSQPQTSQPQTSQPTSTNSDTDVNPDQTTNEVKTDSDDNVVLTIQPGYIKRPATTREVNPPATASNTNPFITSVQLDKMI
jgi:hypothetical protein